MDYIIPSPRKELHWKWSHIAAADTWVGLIRFEWIWCIITRGSTPSPPSLHSPSRLPVATHDVPTLRPRHIHHSLVPRRAYLVSSPSSTHARGADDVCAVSVKGCGASGQCCPTSGHVGQGCSARRVHASLSTPVSQVLLPRCLRHPQWVSLPCLAYLRLASTVQETSWLPPSAVLHLIGAIGGHKVALGHAVSLVRDVVRQKPPIVRRTSRRNRSTPCSNPSHT
ncbi:hypothetical protein B0I35DRAFT_134098 [Stachybotrys elegans]|uniref:Uncharacterized protein n=1 Tax=Stachybotrys elegans TaxID=80388 RepID=A0A8K0T3G3_9HYPO|nr:hypothetical protein B0I35DRAFT_134098 [Stachybotrys elegans]